MTSHATDFERLLEAYGQAYANDLVEFHLPRIIYNHEPLREARTALLALVAGVCKDAGRYRYLRECYPNDSPMTVVANPKLLLAGTLCHTAERLDAAIDAALAATDKEPT